MENLANDKDPGEEKQNMESYFEGEVVKKRAKMIKAFGDLYPYEFYVTYGHDFEDVVLKGEDHDALDREEKKLVPFDNMSRMHEVDKKAEKEFFRILDDLEKQKPSPSLNKFLEKRKEECAYVLELFDRIVDMCRNYFQMEYEDCKKRVQKQLKPFIGEVEKFLSGVEETGDKEVVHLRESMAAWTQELGANLLNKIKDLHEKTHSQPLGMTVWHECTQELTSRDIRSAFLADQKEMAVHWQKAFEDLFMLSTELEKIRVNYYLTRSKLEKEVFWMEKDYKKNVPNLTKIQRELTDQVSKRTRLKKKLRCLKDEYDQEKEQLMKTQLKLYERITSTRQANKLAHDNAVKKCRNVVDMKKSEVEELLSDLVEGDKFIHEDILEVEWKAPDTSVWKDKLMMEDAFSNEVAFLQKLSAKVPGERQRDEKEKIERKGKEIRTLHDDAFAEAYRILVSNGEFEAVLNEIATELGYMLDFKWVNYVKETLNLNHEVKWIEMFKVFRINFVEDLKEMKDHMTSYCKLKENGDLVFNSQGAMDGFLHFVCKKRQSTSSSKTSLDEPELVVEEEYWNAVIKTMPNSLLWESAEETLEEYRQALKTRAMLKDKKSVWLRKNAEIEKSLENYFIYSIPKV